MTAPTFVASYLAGSSFGDSNSPKATASINRASGDVLYAVVQAEDTGMGDITISAETGIAWGAAKQIVTTASRTKAWLFSAVASSAANTTVTFTESSATAFQWGARIFHWTNSGGLGVTNKGDGADSAASVILTGVALDSAIVMGIGDWEAGPATITYRTADAGTFTQTDGTDHGNSYTQWTGYHANAGAAGNKTVGETSPTAPDWSLVAGEVLGIASAATRVPPRVSQYSSYH